VTLQKSRTLILLPATNCQLWMA